MKTITLTLAALLISACSHGMKSSTSNEEATSRRSSYSGSSTVPQRSDTMNDRDKMLEACRGLRTDRSCDEIIQSCQAQPDHLACMHNYMKK